jgi:TAT (twin-arginine translocation) pathway signal sequence
MTSPGTPTSLSRRGFLAGAAAATAVPVLGGWSPASAATSAVTPVWSETLRRSYGVCVHPNATKTGYGFVNDWAGYVGGINAGYIRGKYTPSLKQTQVAIDRCRALGLKWLMSVIPEDWSITDAQLKASLAHIRDHAADICIGIEGINEPNSNRDGSPLRTDWAAATVRLQRIIKEFCAATPSMSHVVVVGPSLCLSVDRPYDDFVALANAGVVQFMDYAGIHSYPAGLKPDNQVDTRLGWVRSAWGSLPTWVSETGYNTAINSPLRGPRSVPGDIAAVYGPRSVLEYFSRGAKAARYELLDDPNPGLDVPEYNYGLLKATGIDPSTWVPKPEFATMQAFLGSLRDSATAYQPAPVQLQVVAPTSVSWTLVGRSDGSSTLLAYQNVSAYNAVKRLRVTVVPVDVTITDRIGTRVVKVGAEVTSIPLR